MSATGGAIARTAAPAAAAARQRLLGGRGRRRERRLARGLRRRDPEAIETVQREHGGMLLGYLTSLLGDRAAAEDVLQLTLLELWRRGPEYDPARGSPLTWTLTIARSRALDQLRQRLPEPREPATAAALADRDAAVRADADAADRLLDQWQVADLLGRLPLEEAELLRLRFYGGLTQREIADRTGIPLGTVKMRMVQALGRLRDLLDAEGEVTG